MVRKSWREKCAEFRNARLALVWLCFCFQVSNPKFQKHRFLAYVSRLLYFIYLENERTNNTGKQKRLSKCNENNRTKSNLLTTLITHIKVVYMHIPKMHNLCARSFASLACSLSFNCVHNYIMLVAFCTYSYERTAHTIPCIIIYRTVGIDRIEAGWLGCIAHTERRTTLTL